MGPIVLLPLLTDVDLPVWVDINLDFLFLVKEYSCVAMLELLAHTVYTART